ncbi:NHL repeat-containing protein [Roseiarcus fermentans]|uniref:NHL repeat-containing protein n=1 Tax=Roseiarcus fermentans TaxID=1473586 RepID=A0A366FLE5_9HYPH|nr:hypothetical protein [Roseiarcus fermentans]RBP15514.1 NHL repeat-containing protein [Roseiarcus fermentans]
MAAIFRRLFFGGEQQSAPVFDGVLRPNQDLDLCRLIARGLESPDDVAIVSGDPVVSSGARIVRVTGQWFAPLQSTVAVLDGVGGALAALPDGGLAVAVDGDRIVFVGGGRDGRVLREAASQAFTCVTAIAVAGDRMLVAEGSHRNPLAHWRRDLFQGNRAGRVVEIDLVSGRDRLVAGALAWPQGVAALPNGDVLVAESWAHRVRALGDPRFGYDDIPAYPGRLCAAAGGGFWLCCFAARTQLVDFVLADRRLSERMMREVDEEFWIAPALAATDHPHEPTQLGGVKQYGVRKPWAPARSYGLVIRLDEELSPAASLHSRVDGKRHGVTGVATAAGAVFLTSKGNGKLLRHDEESTGDLR